MTLGLGSKIAIAFGVVALTGAATYVATPRERIIGAFSTSLAGRTHAQASNAKLALSRLINAEIPPGAEFSFNRRVGTFSRDQGYRRAPVSYNGQLIDDWGGGVCQTSTTLYNAALLAGLPITERHHHRFAPSYVLPGRDAAVAFSNIDLRFRDPFSFPIRIEGDTQGNRLNLRILGAQLPPNRAQILSDVREVRAPQTFRIGESNGRRRVRNTGKPGCEVFVYRVIGNQQEPISHDVYPAMNRVEETIPNSP
jgi:vancomycin resistance protein VanW